MYPTYNPDEVRFWFVTKEQLIGAAPLNKTNLDLLDPNVDLKIVVAGWLQTRDDVMFHLLFLST